MDGIVPKFRFAASQRIKQHVGRFVRQRKDAGPSRRSLIILNQANGQSVGQTGRTLHVSRTTGYRVAERFRDHEIAGLPDRREDNGQHKLDDDYLGLLYDVMRDSPSELTAPSRRGINRIVWDMHPPPRQRVANPDESPDFIPAGTDKVTVSLGDEERTTTVEVLSVPGK